MKFNWKVALMCVATLAMVACKDKKDDEVNGGGSGGGRSLDGYVAPIDVTDKSLADWDKLDQSKVAVDVLTAQHPLWGGLKKIQVYADSICIFYALTFDPAAITTPNETAGFHIYLNADNNPNTGGFWDLFAPANNGNCDLMFEGTLWDAAGNRTSYLPPHVSYWSGPTGGNTWLWTEILNINEKISLSQFVSDGVVEGYLIRDLIPWSKWSSAFEIGFEMYDDNYTEIGLLPQGDAVSGGAEVGRKPKLKVTFDE